MKEFIAGTGRLSETVANQAHSCKPDDMLELADPMPNAGCEYALVHCPTFSLCCAVPTVGSDQVGKTRVCKLSTTSKTAEVL